MGGDSSTGGTILVTGAAGKTGRAVLRALRDCEAPARALVRRREQEEVARAAGARDVMRGDLRDPQAMVQATAGAAAVYHIAPNMSPDEIEIGRTVLAAAHRAGVRRFVFHSVLHPQTEAMSHHWRKLRVEEQLLETGLPFTILQPAAYMQNVLAQRQRLLEEGSYSVPYDRATRIAMVDLVDVAEVAAKVLTEDGHLGATYELCAENLTQDEVAAQLGEALGRPIRAVTVPLERWRAQARSSGLDEARCEALLTMFRFYQRHGFTGNRNVLRWLLGREPTSFRDFASRAAQSRTPVG